MYNISDALWSSARHLGALDGAATLALCSDEAAVAAPDGVVTLSLEQSLRPPVDVAVGTLPPLDTMQSLRCGGVAVLLTPTSFLDSYDSVLRQRLCCDAELLLALRLPQGAISDTLSHDVLILRRRIVDLLRPVGDWLESTRLDEDADDQWAAACAMRPSFGTLCFNRYWHKWPGHALGKWTTERQAGGAVGVAVKWRDGEGVVDLCRGIIAAVQRWATENAPRRAVEALTPSPPTAALSPLDRAAKRCLDALRAVLVAQQRGGAFRDEQRLLGAVYGAFVARWGLLRDVDRDTVSADLRQSWPLLLALERRDGSRAAVFSRRVVAVTAAPTCETIEEVMNDTKRLESISLLVERSD